MIYFIQYMYMRSTHSNPSSPQTLLGGLSALLHLMQTVLIDVKTSFYHFTRSDDRKKFPKRGTMVRALTALYVIEATPELIALSLLLATLSFTFTNVTLSAEIMQCQIEPDTDHITIEEQFIGQKKPSE